MSFKGKMFEEDQYALRVKSTQWGLKPGCNYHQDNIGG